MNSCVLHPRDNSGRFVTPYPAFGSQQGRPRTGLFSTRGLTDISDRSLALCVYGSPCSTDISLELHLAIDWANGMLGSREEDSSGTPVFSKATEAI